MNTLRTQPQGDLEIVMERSFAAPRALVFRAITTPALLERWLLGPDGWTLSVPVWDFQVGGAYRYVWTHTTQGKTMGAGGVFLEIAGPEKLVNTERFDDPWYAGESVVTQVLTEDSGETTLTMTMRFESQTTRDAVLGSGMESGVAVSYDRLEKLLETLA